MIKKWLLFITVIILTAIAVSALYYRAGTSMSPLPPLSPTPSPIVSPSALPTAGLSSTLMMRQLSEPLPLIYSDTLEEKQVQQYLKQGAVVLPLGTSIGEPGNVVITAHSSGFESFGPYRFAFAKLSELKEGEEFQITVNSAVYTYRAYAKEIVWPSQVDKLPQDNRSTVTLVTCWPIWTDFKRLLVHGELVAVEK